MRRHWRRQLLTLEGISEFIGRLMCILLAHDYDVDMLEMSSSILQETGACFRLLLKAYLADVNRI
jgi:hypothetical protein